MKKIIVLLFMFILTGCSTEYNLILENNEFKESLKVTSTKNDEFVNEISNYYNKNYLNNYKIELGDMSENEYISKFGGVYEKKIINENENYGLELGYNYYNKESYNNSAIVHTLFDNFYVGDNVIRAYNIKNIFEYYKNINEIKLVFETDSNVIETNADEVVNNKFYWYINKNNFNDKNIFIKYSKQEGLVTEDGYLTGSVIKYILMALIIFVLISIPIIYEKVKKSNN